MIAWGTPIRRGLAREPGLAEPLPSSRRRDLPLEVQTSVRERSHVSDQDVFDKPPTGIGAIPMVVAMRERFSSISKGLLGGRRPLPDGTGKVDAAGFTERLSM